MERAFIYGDSLLKATMPDADMRYHFHLPEVMAQYPSDRLEVVNRAAAMTAISTGRPSPPRRRRTTCPARPCRSLRRSCTAPSRR